MSGHDLGRPFAFLWSSTALSNLADGVLKVGAPLLAVSMTRSPTLVSLVGAAATLPWLLLALPAGAVADRADRRRIMAGAGAVRAIALGSRRCWRRRGRSTCGCCSRPCWRPAWPRSSPTPRRRPSCR